MKRLAVFPLLLALASAAPALAQGVRDSVLVDMSILPIYVTYTITGSNGQPQPMLECGGRIMLRHPDFAATPQRSAFYTYTPWPYNWRPSWDARPDSGVITGNLGGRGGGGPLRFVAPRCGEYISAAAAIASLVDVYALHTYPEGPPVAKFDTTRGDGLTVSFDGSGSFEPVRGRKVPVASYRWTFGDGSAAETGTAPSHTYAEPGRYIVTLEVTDDDGQTDTFSRSVTVAKPGLVVWAEALDADRTYRRGDDVYVVGTVENRSDKAVTDIKVPLDFGLGVSYPPHVEPFYKEGVGYVRESSKGRADTTISVLGPGERAEILQSFRVETYATYMRSTRLVSTEATGYGMLLGVTAKDEAGAAVPVEAKCGVAPCGKTWKVVPSWVARAEFHTDNRVTFQATSGVGYNPDLRSAELAPFNFETVQPFTFQFVDGALTRFCHSACADLRVVVTDSLLGGAPVEGATVVVTAPTLAAGVSVTPDQGGGHVCVRGTVSYTCAKTVTVKTNEKGEAPPMYYAFPGLVAPTEVKVDVLVRDGSILMRELAPPLRLLPNERTDFTRTITLGSDEAAWLNAMLTTITAGTAGNAAGEFCEGYVKFLGGANATSSIIRPSTSSVLHRGRNLLAEWVCTLNPVSLWGQETAGNAKKIAETALIGWFGARFIPPDAGLGTLTGPYPPPFVFYWDGDYYGAILDAIKGAAPQIAPGATMTLRLFEVSWLQKETVFNGRPMVPNAYFSLETSRNGTATHTALLELGYDAEIWMSPASTGQLAAAASAGDDRLGVGPVGGAPSQAPAATTGPAAGLASAPGHGHGLDITVEAGDFLLLESPVGAYELAQVRAVERGTPEAGFTVRLTRPLRASYGAGSRVHVRRDSVAVAPPSRPVLVTRDSVSTAVPLVLDWAMGPFETPQAFDVQVARDTLFATLLREGTGTEPDSLLYGPIANGEVIYWRVRAVNLVGTGPWSRPVRIVASDAVTVGSEGAGAIPAGAVSLGAPHPNPSQTATSVTFVLPAPSDVRLSVYDLLGREVAVLVDETRAAGPHEATLDASGLPPGVYVVRLVAGRERRTQRLVVR